MFKTLIISVRRAAIRDDFAQARFLNAQNFQYQLMKSGGVLDQQVLQAALGKRQPRQRMWGLSGPVVLGVCPDASREPHGGSTYDPPTNVLHRQSFSRGSAGREALTIQPITVTAQNEACGNPSRAVRYFCFTCNLVHDTARLNPLTPCPLPLSVLTGPPGNTFCTCWHTCPA